MDNDSPDVGRKRRDRMRDILERVRAQGSVGTDELIQACGVSAATVRRDLSELEARGLVVRSYGRVEAVGVLPEMPVVMRASEADAAKRAVARLAARLLPPGRQAIAVSGGTTTKEVVRALGDRNGLTVITNAVTIALEVSRSPRVKTILTGGTLRATSLEAVGPLAEAAFSAFKVTTAFLGTDGISASGGVTTHDDTEARTNGVMVTHADRVVVVCDGSKVGRQTMARMADIGDVSVLVTDEHAPADALEQIAAAGVEVLIA
ncbi:alkaline phosphatase [Curtobacterium sp. MCSS17_008]|uniref:DeoR/GlpR family DNA-binding transcription regulator n=1 Tax=Curtobacterium sp. MCSS17_008 TaxID=2175647 RepID=UPI000DAA4613|nr:DeoR/GlpR family DNA-binding transcription regulator [Curtobacterium sp. MCSS17_008]PZF53884.1 alkaline phosphatase [Curtobacterium sp. MCSS17_008]